MKNGLFHLPMNKNERIKCEVRQSSEKRKTNLNLSKVNVVSRSGVNHFVLNASHHISDLKMKRKKRRKKNTTDDVKDRLNLIHLDRSKNEIWQKKQQRQDRDEETTKLPVNDWLLSFV